jgi:chitodextrinase
MRGGEKMKRTLSLFTFIALILFVFNTQKTYAAYVPVQSDNIFYNALVKSGATNGDINPSTLDFAGASRFVNNAVSDLDDLTGVSQGTSYWYFKFDTTLPHIFIGKFHHTNMAGSVYFYNEQGLMLGGFGTDVKDPTYYTIDNSYNVKYARVQAPSGTWYTLFAANDNQAPPTPTPVPTPTPTPTPTPPSIPTGLIATSGDNRVSLRWNTNPEPGVTYQVGVDNSNYGSVISSTNLTIDSLNNDQIYYFTVSAIGVNGLRSNSAGTYSTPKDTTPPDTPIITYADIGDTELILHWSSSTDNHAVAGYNVFVNGVKKNTSLITGLSFKVIGLVNAQSYAYTVSAVDTSGNESNRSPPNYYSTVDSTPPSVPTNLRGIAGDSSVDLMIDANKETDLAGYYFYQDGVKLNDSLVTGTSYHVGYGLINYVSYSFQVASVDKTGNVSNKSSAINLMPIDLTPPPTTENFYGTSGVGNVRFNWAPIPNIDNDLKGYFLYMDGVRYFDTPINQTTFEALVPTGVKHDFTLTAIDIHGNESVHSSIVSIASNNPPPVKVPVLSSTSQTHNSISLNWTISGISYEIYKDGLLVDTVTSLSNVVSNLSPNTIYKFRIIALDEYGRKTESNELTLSTKDIPPPYSPTLSYSSLTKDSLTLNWTDVKGAYKIYQDNNLISSTSALYSRVSGLSPDTIYEFKLVSKDEFGRDNVSNVLTLRTLKTPPPTPTPPPPQPPPHVGDSNNPALNDATDHLVQGVKDTKTNGVNLILIVIGVIILVIGTMWLVKIMKRNMARTERDRRNTRVYEESYIKSKGRIDGAKKDATAMPPKLSSSNAISKGSNVTPIKKSYTPKRRFNNEKTYKPFQKRYKKT